MVKGIDVAYYDRLMNWSLYDWDFAYIKVSEGLVIDSEFRNHWIASKGRTYRGAYHFFRQFVDPKLSVLKCLEYLGDDRGELPLWFDLEVNSIDAAERVNIAAKAKSWLSWYEQFTGVRPIIYTSLNILFALDAVADIGWMRNYKLCLAQYRYDELSVDMRTRILHQILTGEISYAFPPAPYPFMRVVMTQWTGKGNPADVPGYYVGVGGKLAVDFNFYPGDLESFKQEFNLQPLNIPTGEPMSRYEATALSDGTRLRRDHNTANTIVGSYPAGTKFHGDTLFTATVQLSNSYGVYQKVGDQWLSVTDVNGVPTTVESWVAVTHMGNVITVLNDSGPVEPPPSTLPATWEVTQVAKDDNGNVLATYTGILTRQ